ncbi:nucleoside triphosphate pyrophosphohydrolase [Marinilactibacillus sp. Marseille-P9653]|uniref:nucleoside triphosphate pyrophosphohydrolase n=1 Tax=Marinilactibacillus sp. Marseille-P9653 TaxID=2866583 RepID=UPI001CE3B939|nr:nucleoside triphosphate pyrophosphohydrolase [Marinilactibacillus sp. Marseille-P9653]
MKNYNKLVRDNIPQILENNGQIGHFKVLNENEYRLKLRQKLKEEVNEYLLAENDDSCIEELSDIIEVIHSLAGVHKQSVESLEKRRLEKLTERGGFKNRIMLIATE